MPQKIWFITGAGRGFGHDWARAALNRGDMVAATARSVSALSELVAEFGDSVLPIELDVTDRAGDFAAISETYHHFGRLDVVVNNAGYGQFGCIEEISEPEVRAQMETNVLGALWITQASLPYLRDQGSGHIIQVSSAGGVVSLADMGIYSASKFALEGFSEALYHEMKAFGIRVTLIEPGPFATDFTAQIRRPDRIPAYDAIHAEAKRFGDEMLSRPGDPAASAEALLTIVDADDPPLRVLFGTTALSIVKSAYAERLSSWEAWQPVTTQAHG